MPEEKGLTVVERPLPSVIEQSLKQPPQSAKLTRLAAFTPANLTEAIALSKLIASSDLAPKEYRGKPGNVLIGMQYAAELGISPLLGIQNISIINGRASVWGDLFLALIQAHPDYETHKEYYEGAGEGRTAVCQMKRKGSEVHTVKFSVADARTARLWGKEGPWKTNPDRMLQMRARGFCGRDKFSDALKGLVIAEEAMDIPPDNLDVKKQREAATLDVSTLQPSIEQNRGHADTGLERSAPTIDMPSQEQTKQVEDVICNDCRRTNGHADDCPHKQAETKTSKPTTQMRLTIAKIVAKQKKKNTKDQFYLVAPVIDESQQRISAVHLGHEVLSLL
jgi:hypothetical protein